MEGDQTCGRFRTSLPGFGKDKMKKTFVLPPDAYESHQVFMVLDGQNLYGRELKFSYINIASYLAKLIPQKVWENKTEKLNIYEKFLVAAPAPII
jgi:hypothetical protein